MMKLYGLLFRRYRCLCICMHGGMHVCNDVCMYACTRLYHTHSACMHTVCVTASLPVGPHACAPPVSKSVLATNRVPTITQYVCMPVIRTPVCRHACAHACKSARPRLHPYAACMDVNVHDCMSVCLTECMSVCPPAHRCAHPPARLSFHPSARSPALLCSRPSTKLSACVVVVRYFCMYV